MTLVNKNITISLLFSLVIGNAEAQFSTCLLKENARALRIHKVGQDMSYPLIDLARGDAITVSFDLIVPEMHQLSYSIIHCNAEWERSGLFVNEYLDGFQKAYIENYDYSQATNIDYVHYELQIPNEDMQIKISGNYTVVVCDEDEGDTLLTACFSVVERLVDIFGAVGGISTSGNSGDMQQLNFTVDHSNYTIRQPITETKVVVMKNNSRVHQVTASTPTYIHAGRLVFEQHPLFAFPGGDEYHVLETSSLRFPDKGVESITFFSPFYHVDVRPHIMNQNADYEFRHDINGKFLIRRRESGEGKADTEADYMVAHFRVPMKTPILDGKVYLNGDFTYDTFDATTQLTYNAQARAYEGHLLLKQGYYNYRYYVLSKRDGQIKSAPVEINAHRTENDYQIFFFHRPMGERYDRLIGYQVINTLDK